MRPPWEGPGDCGCVSRSSPRVPATHVDWDLKVDGTVVDDQGDSGTGVYDRRCLLPVRLGDGFERPLTGSGKGLR